MVATIVTIDLGTSSLRTTVWGVGGRILARAVQGYPTHRPRPDYAQQEPRDWWNAFVATFRKAVGAGAGGIQAIAVASQREGVVPVGRVCLVVVLFYVEM